VIEPEKDGQPAERQPKFPGRPTVLPPNVSSRASAASRPASARCSQRERLAHDEVREFRRVGLEDVRAWHLAGRACPSAISLDQEQLGLQPAERDPPVCIGSQRVLPQRRHRFADLVGRERAHLADGCGHGLSGRGDRDRAVAADSSQQREPVTTPDPEVLIANAQLIAGWHDDGRAMTGGSLVRFARQARAADGQLPCQLEDPHLWFSDLPADLVPAKTHCGPCPLRAPRLAGALERGEPHGVWGGEILARGAGHHDISVEVCLQIRRPGRADSLFRHRRNVAVPRRRPRRDRDSGLDMIRYGPLWMSAAHRSGRSGYLPRSSRMTWWSAVGAWSAVGVAGRCR
jgi:hypothetical protein